MNRQIISWTETQGDKNTKSNLKLLHCFTSPKFILTTFHLLKNIERVKPINSDFFLVYITFKDGSVLEGIQKII